MFFSHNIQLFLYFFRGELYTMVAKRPNSHVSRKARFLDDEKWQDDLSDKLMSTEGVDIIFMVWRERAKTRHKYSNHIGAPQNMYAE
jgi:hypothetical protein